PLSRCATASRRTSACAANPNFRASRFSIPPYTISPPKSHPFSWNVNIIAASRARVHSTIVIAVVLAQVCINGGF
ncbi:MAG: hypothetical protein ACK5WY_08770, partial [Holosporaceae bacterium]